MSSKNLKIVPSSMTRRGAFFNPNINVVKFQSVATLRAPVGRNQLCPCGSGKKYKVCCRVKVNKAIGDIAKGK